MTAEPLLCSYFSAIPAPASARSYICSSFAHVLAHSCGGMFAGVQALALNRMLATGAASAMVAIPRAIGYEDEFAGWCVSMEDAIVAVYVRSKLRRQGIATMLLAGVTERVPIAVGYWSGEAQAIADHGFPIVHDPKIQHALLAFVRDADGKQYEKQHEKGTR